MTKPTIVTVVGTRPEIIRLSMVIKRLDEMANHILIHTGQNYDRQLNDVFFEELGVRAPDRYLSVDTSSLGSVIGDTIKKSAEILEEVKPDGVLILGDTNSGMAAIVAKRMHIPVYHMEAGNRSFDENVPEETNRRIIDHSSDFNMPYTEHARRNLLAEGIHPRRMITTGSPMREVIDHYRDSIEGSDVLDRLELTEGGFFLVSAHRQENVDNPERLTALVETLKAVRDKWNLPVMVSTHPRTRARLAKLPEFDDLTGINFHEPFGFFDYNKLQMTAKCVISDSGTISEESALLGFPAITIRDSMERPEALDSGGMIMTGLRADNVVLGIEEATASYSNSPVIPEAYQVADTSRRVVRFILSTVFPPSRLGGYPQGRLILADRPDRTTVVLVCMVDSIHSARWIEQFRDQAIDFVLFPSTPNRVVHARITALRSGDQAASISIAPFGGALSIPLWGSDLLFDDHVRGFLLRRLLRRLKPDFVHALELNHGGYIASRALEGLADAPPFIATNWGSDIYWFRQYPKHEKRIRDMLAKASFYSAECERDVQLAVEYGFTGQAFDVFPNAGGFATDLLTRNQTVPSTRKTLIIKGYEGWVGRASLALQAVELVSERLAGYRLVVYSANAKTQRLARETSQRTGLDITVYPKKALSHERMMELFGEARAYVGISLSDGISTSLLEAMTNGAFPIQTGTSCASEWITDGRTGEIVDASDVEGIAAAIRTALENDSLVDSAAMSNAGVARTKLDENLIKQKSFRFYGLGSSSDINSA